MTTTLGAEEARRQRRAPRKKASSTKGLEFSDADVATFEAYVQRRVGGIDWILAIDPGTDSTGWAICDPMNGDDILSGQAPNEIVACNLVRAGHSSSLLTVLEAPYSGRSPEAFIDEQGQAKVRGSRATPETTWKLGRAMGVVQGALYSDRYMRGLNPGLIWTPPPGRWRAILDLNSPLKGKAARADVAERCWRFARSVTKRHLEGPMGGRCIDEAMAVCMVVAARKVAKVFADRCAT